MNKKLIPLLISAGHLIALFFLARLHNIGNFATETDFYHYYGPDAQRLGAWMFPQNPYQGPGYPGILALIVKITGTDIFITAKWLSVIAAVACGLLTYVLFARLFGFWAGVGAQLLVIVSGEFPQFSINATTDVFFLMLCLAVCVIFTDELIPDRSRIALTGALCALAYLTRYNGIFLLIAVLVAIFVLDIFINRNFETKLGYGFLLIVTFLIVCSPWLFTNTLHRGSPIYNTNYLNVAAEYYPEIVNGAVNQDATRVLSEKFHSFWDVLTYDVTRMATHYPINIYKSLRLSITDNLVHPVVACIALFGILMGLLAHSSKELKFILITGGVYIAIMALNHWETRYYFFIMVLYAGFAVFPISRIAEIVYHQGPGGKFIAILLSICFIGTLTTISLIKSSRDVKSFIAAQPNELIVARDYILGNNPQNIKILARKPHLAYLTQSEWVFFPQVKSPDELQNWLKTNKVDYIVIGKRELKERKTLAPLADANNHPAWLKPVLVNDEAKMILYKPVN